MAFRIGEPISDLNPMPIAALASSTALIGKVLMTEDVLLTAAVLSTIIANGGTVVLPLKGFNGATFAWWGTFAGITLQFEACYDGSGINWIPINAVSVSGGAVVNSVAGLAAAGAYEIYAPGASHLRVRCSAYTSGTMNVKGIPSVLASDIAPSVGGGSVTAILSGALAAGTNLVGDVGLQPRATAGGLALNARLLASAATTNATLVKASAGRIYKIRGLNAVASIRYLKLYNKATAPTVGTDVPVETFALAASQPFDIDFGALGLYFATGISYAITGAIADVDTTAIALNDILATNVFYA